MTLPFQEETYSVSELCEEVRELMRQAYPQVWVAGEVNRIRPHRSGHVYFELIEKGQDDRIVSKLEAVSWRKDYLHIRQILARSDQEITEGQTIRCRGRLDFYPPFGRMQFVVREVDPVFTLGHLAKRRQETLVALTKAGLLEKNRALLLSQVPLRIGLITSHESAAYHDFLSSLAESEYAFHVRFVHAAVQGRDSEQEIVSAIESLGRAPVDCLVLIRGGGSRSDLAVFDSRRVAESIALSPLPLLTGLGHEIDQAIADKVAHSAFKTPTKVAEFLVERVGSAERAITDLARSLGQASMEVLHRRRRGLERRERELAMARHRLTSSAKELRYLARRLPVAVAALLRSRRIRVREIPRRLVGFAPAHIERCRRRQSQLAERLSSRSQMRLRELAVKLSEWERLCVQLAPERTLERGFSITRDARGRVLKDPESVGPGDRLVIQLAGGRLDGRVEEA